MTKPILSIDFDGVLHAYTSGWKGADVVADPPVPGAIDFLREACEFFRVAVFSSRSNQEGGTDAMRCWLDRHIVAAHGEPGLAWSAAIEWPTEKPPAMVTLDDRAVTFTGTFPSVESLLAFKPWNKR